MVGVRSNGVSGSRGQGGGGGDGGLRVGGSRG